MDKKEKQETLSKLYALRAGLSLISQEKDEADSILESRKTINDRLNTLIGQAESELKSEKDRALSDEKYITRKIEAEQSAISRAEEKINNIEEKMQQITGSKAKLSRSATYLLRIVGIGIGIAIMAYLGINEISKINSESTKFGIGLIIFLFVGAAILTIVCLISIISTAKGKTKEINNKSHEIFEQEEKISQHRHNIKQNKEEILSIRAESAKKQEELQKNIVDVKKAARVVSALTDDVSIEMLSTHKETALGIYKSLAAEYSEILDERDWQYIDLFIYMYETGRAESKKEALQLIDQYQQNKNIVDAIVRAGREVQDCIKQGLGALQTAMESHFRALSGQLYEMHSETMLKMDRITDQLDNLNSEMSRMSLGMAQISSQTADMQRQLDLNTALQAKANMTSQQIMDDVKYMRTLDENAEVRRRNGLNSYGSYA